MVHRVDHSDLVLYAAQTQELLSSIILSRSATWFYNPRWVDYSCCFLKEIFFRSFFSVKRKCSNFAWYFSFWVAVYCIDLIPLKISILLQVPYCRPNDTRRDNPQIMLYFDLKLTFGWFPHFLPHASIDSDFNRWVNSSNVFIAFFEFSP